MTAKSGIHIIVSALLALPAYGHAASVASNWGLCPADNGVPAMPMDHSNDESLHIAADSAELNETGVSTLIGDVQITKGSKQFASEKILFNRDEETLDLKDDLKFWSNNVYLRGSDGHFNLADDHGVINNVSYQLVDRHGRGESESIEISDTDTVTLENTTYTTCVPSQPDWELKASEIHLDRQTDVGTAKNVTVKFKEVPVFYSPYMTFPLSDKRKSGFLTAVYGSSNDSGLEVSVPYYWNIAPEMDATLGIRAMSKRGAMLQGEYRFLTEDGKGELGIEYLPHDNQYDDSRALYTVDYEQRFAEHWSALFDINHVTDNDYFTDLGTQLNTSGRRFLNREARAQYNNGPWSALARIQSYQTVDNNIANIDRPYRRLPQLTLNWGKPSQNNTLNMSVNTEYVNFDHKTNVTGRRLNLNPVLGYPMRTRSSFIIPRLSMDYTYYNLANQVAGKPDSLTRTVPTVSLDSGLFFERDAVFGSQTFIQTLEPRAYYLYTPYRSQSNIPNFDTGEYTFSFAQLFRENRFSGSDKIGDANQLTLAVTSRLLNPQNGKELFSASIGQIHYFRNREVQLNNLTPAQASNSDVVAEVAALIDDNWKVRGGLQWDGTTNTTKKSTISVRYQPDEASVINLGYRQIQGQLEQADISTKWPINHQWGFVGRLNYELPDNRVLDSFIGFEYESCCWAIKTVVRHYTETDSADYSTGLYFQFELKGLAGIGKKTQTLLENQIPGYNNTF